MTVDFYFIINDFQKSPVILEIMCMFFFPAVFDTNDKITTFFVLSILQKLKPEVFFHHTEFLKEISSIQYQVLVKFRRNRCKIIIFEFPFTTETLHWLFWIWIMQSNWIWKKLKQVITSQLLTKHFASLLFLLLWRPPLRYFLNVAFAFLLREKTKKRHFLIVSTMGETTKYSFYQ